MSEHLHLAVALDGYGWHPQAWRAVAPSTDPVTSGRYWADLAATAERGLLDFLTIDDTLMPQPAAPREHRSRAGWPVAPTPCWSPPRIAPATQHIGLIPVATVTHTEPFHVSKAIATLDYVSHGRAGWQARVSVDHARGGAVRPPDVVRADLFDEAADLVEVVRRLWDSWEDDAVIRDVATGRYVDRDKLHYIDFTGKYFSVKGPSITPRPPQGQPVVAALAHAAASTNSPRAAPISSSSPRTDDDSLAGHPRRGARRRWHRPEGLCRRGACRSTATADFRSDALVFAGSPTELVDLLLRWQRLGIDGARLRPAVNATDLPVIVDEVVPLLQRAGRFRTGYRDGETLRERLGLPVAANRYATVEQS